MPKPLQERPDANEVLAQLGRILQSPRFRRSPRSRDLLKFIVEETLDGRAAGLNQFSIATRALGRAEDFDPASDPAARMQASRVRQALEHFVLAEGVADPVMITLPVGSYCPTFQYRHRNSTSSPQVDGDNRNDWPTLLLAPLRNLERGGDLDYLSDGLVYDLAAELDRYSGLRVFLGQTPPQSPSEPTGTHGERAIDFKLIGSLDRISSRIRLTFHLVDAKSGEQIWADEFRCAESGAELLLIRDELPRRIAATIAEERGVIQEHEQNNLRGESSEWSEAYRAVLLGYHFEQVMSPEAFIEALEALSRAVEDSPDCGQAWAMLSRLWSAQFSHELSGKPEGIERALECAHKAVALRPNDPSARASLAYAFLLNDQAEECREQADSALEKNPHTLFFMDTIGYLLTLSGDWDRGPVLSRRSIQLNPFPRRVVHAGLWLDAIRRADYEEALSEAKKVSDEGTFWSPLMRLTARVLSGQSNHDAVSAEATQLLAYKPDFVVNGRRLIRNYVKFPDIRSRIEEGLRGAGILLGESDSPRR